MVWQDPRAVARQYASDRLTRYPRGCGGCRLFQQQRPPQFNVGWISAGIVWQRPNHLVPFGSRLAWYLS
jgi:hypothetical protein